MTDSALEAHCALVARSAAAWENARRYPLDAMGEAGKSGLTGMLTPREAGGLGLGPGEACDIVSRIAGEGLWPRLCSQGPRQHDGEPGPVREKGPHRAPS